MRFDRGEVAASKQIPQRLWVGVAWLAVVAKVVTITPTDQGLHHRFRCLAKREAGLSSVRG